MHHGVLWVSQNQSLEVHESQIVIAQKIGTFTSVDISILKGLLKVYSYGQVFHRL